MSWIKKLKYSSNIGFALVLLIYKFYILLSYRLFSSEFYIKRNFLKKYGDNLNLRTPKTLNEKIQWYKFHFKLPLIEQCADKYNVRTYVAERIGQEYLVPLVLTTTKPKEIRPDKLPDYPFIIKANHNSGTNHIIYNKDTANWNKIRTDCRWWLNLNYYYMEKEWQYKNIKPRIVVEKLLLDKNNQIPSDYKLHFINGKFQFLQLDLDRFSQHRRNFYNEEWKLLPFTWSALDDKQNVKWINGRNIEKPKNLNELISLGAKLAEPFPYVRVDFYIVDKKIYFGELTFHHGGGYEHFVPEKWDYFYGEKLPLVKTP